MPNATNELEESRIVDTRVEKDEAVVENAIRPSQLSEYIGQEKVREQMEIFISAAKQRQEALDHVLIFGPPGLGKTTLSNIRPHSRRQVMAMAQNEKGRFTENGITVRRSIGTD